MIFVCGVSYDIINNPNNAIANTVIEPIPSELVFKISAIIPRTTSGGIKVVPEKSNPKKTDNDRLFQ